LHSWTYRSWIPTC